MYSCELYKIRNQRTPIACAVGLLVAVLSPAAVLLFYTPSSEAAYLETFTSVYWVFAPLLAIVFGGWVLGTEYRQGTLKRLLTSESRRLRALSVKASVGLGALVAALGAAAFGGWAAARVVASMNSVTIPWNGRELLAAGLLAVAGAVVAFALSVVTRSDSFAMVGTVALLLILDPLLSIVPKVGKYSFGSVLDIVSNKLAGLTADGAFVATSSVSTATASVALALWFGLFIGSASYLFVARDV